MNVTEPLSAAPVCVIEGALCEQRFVRLAVDPAGGLWSVAVEEHMRRIYYRAPSSSDETSQKHLFSRFACVYSFDNGDDRTPTDAPHVVFSPITHAEGGTGAASCFALLFSSTDGPHGCLAVFSVPQGAHHREPPAGDGPVIVAEERLHRCFTCATTIGARTFALACLAPAGHGEIRRLHVTETGELLWDSLFCVGSAVVTLLAAVDGSSHSLVSISRDGFIDVWDVDAESDVTSLYGSLSMDCDAYGRPQPGAAAVLAHHEQLWIGTDDGYLVVLPFRRCREGGEEAAPSAEPLHAVRAHQQPLYQILPMCLGSQVWTLSRHREGTSVDGDNMVCVWDAESCRLTGSFAFPEDGLTFLARAPNLKWHVPLYGIERCSGHAVTCTVTEAASDQGVLCRLSRRTTTTAPPACDTDTPPTLAAHMLALLQFASLQLAEAQSSAPPAVVEAVETLMDAQHECPSLGLGNVGFLPDALDTLAKARQILDGVPALVAASRAMKEGDEAPRTFLSDLSYLVYSCQREEALTGETNDFLRGLERKLGMTGPLPSLDAALHAVSERVATATPATSAHPQQDQTSLAKEDVKEVLQQLTSSQLLLQQREERIAALESALLAAQKAASSKEASATHTFDLEAALHEARETIATLQQQVETLRQEQSPQTVSNMVDDRTDRCQRCAVEEHEHLHGTMDRFVRKERLARAAIRRFVETQNLVAEELELLTAFACRRLEESEAAEDPLQPMRALRQVCEQVFMVENFIQDSLVDQRGYFVSVKEEILGESLEGE